MNVLGQHSSTSSSLMSDLPPPVQGTPFIPGHIAAVLLLETETNSWCCYRA